MNPDEYLMWREKLAAAWQADTRFISYLSPEEQWSLHGYFQFHLEKSREEALRYLAEIQAEKPAAEQQGLAAFDRLQTILEELRHGRDPGGAFTYEAPPQGRTKGRRITIRPVVQPEIDIPMLARALIQVARQQLEEEGTVVPADSHVSGRCDGTVDGSHPDLAAYLRCQKAKPQVNRFLQCCQLAIEEVRKQHMSIVTAAEALARASGCPAIARWPVLEALVGLAAQARDGSTSTESRQAWQRFVENVAMVTAPRS